jgi:uncharacterized protein (TIGR03435 family)
MRPLAWLVFLAGPAFAQNPPPPALDVATVKINRPFSPDDRSTWPPFIQAPPGSLRVRNVNLTMAIEWPQISGPADLNSQRCDILAKPGQAVKDDAAMRQMLPTLLADRCKLKVHARPRRWKSWPWSCLRAVTR